MDDGIVARTQQICKTEAVFGEGVGQNTGCTLIAGTVTVRAGRHDEMMLPGISQRKIVMAVMAGVEVEHLDAVQIFRRSGGAFFAERVCLHEQCAVCAVLRGKGRQTLAHDAIRIGQQLVVEAVQQIIVIRAVKAQLSARVHADIVLLRFALEVW